jgi:hypothetical protein
MPVGTRGSVKGLSSADLETLGVEVTLANTYHLMLRPGADVVAEMGGIHRFAAWSGHVLTDSGGYQVLSLAARVDDDGVTFRSTYDGSSHRLTPENAVTVQSLLGADIQMALDVCPPLPSSPAVLRQAVDRTVAWGLRARQAHRRAGREGQALFGIVQGGIDGALRAESARRTVELDFAGYGIGGLSVGETRSEMLAALAPTVAELPADRPRYLMGVGDPVGLVEAVAVGAAWDGDDCRRSPPVAQRGLCPGRGSDRSGLPLCRLRALVACVPTPPVGCRRGLRPATAHDAQPGLDPRPGGPHAGGHRGREPHGPAGRARRPMGASAQHLSLKTPASPPGVISMTARLGGPNPWKSSCSCPCYSS